MPLFPEEGTVCNLCAKADDEHDQAVALGQRVLGGVVIESGLTHDRPDTGPGWYPHGDDVLRDESRRSRRLGGGH